jgi:hypothetical protein
MFRVEEPAADHKARSAVRSGLQAGLSDSRLQPFPGAPTPSARKTAGLNPEVNCKFKPYVGKDFKNLVGEGDYCSLNLLESKYIWPHLDTGPLNYRCGSRSYLGKT